MTIPFPAIKPSGRDFKLGTFPVRTYRSMSGVTAKRSFGNRPFSYELRLEFANIEDATTTLIVKHYMDVKGGFERFTLPSSLFVGMSATLQDYAQAPATIRWEYAGAPEVRSLPCGRSVVQVNLVGEIL